MKCGDFFVHTMKHCYATALYITEAQALIHYTCAYRFTAREHSIRKECGNEPVSRIKMAGYHALVSMGTL